MFKCSVFEMRESHKNPEVGPCTLEKAFWNERHLSTEFNSSRGTKRYLDLDHEESIRKFLLLYTPHYFSLCQYDYQQYYFSYKFYNFRKTIFFFLTWMLSYLHRNSVIALTYYNSINAF
jgi:hypothetical protein